MAYTVKAVVEVLSRGDCAQKRALVAEYLKNGNPATLFKAQRRLARRGLGQVVRQVLLEILCEVRSDPCTPADRAVLMAAVGTCFGMSRQLLPILAKLDSICRRMGKAGCSDPTPEGGRRPIVPTNCEKKGRRSTVRTQFESRSDPFVYAS